MESTEQAVEVTTPELNEPPEPTESNHVLKVTPTESAEASRALMGNTTVEEGYSFTGIGHIFDHHTGSVNRLRFPNNDASRLAMASGDGTISICKTWPLQELKVIATLSGHTGPVADLAWSITNDFLLSASTDGTVRLWDVEQLTCAREFDTVEMSVGQVLACEFQPINNNVFLVGGSSGAIQMMNLSTGKAVKGSRDSLDGAVTCITFESAMGECVWIGTSHGIIQSYLCDITTGQLTRRHRVIIANSAPGVPSPVTSIQARAWISREARDPCLLVNAGPLLFFSIVTKDGQLVLKNTFAVQHITRPIRSCFCPLISFRQGACVVSGSEDTRVYVYDVTVGGVDPKSNAGSKKKCVTVLQGHSTPVLDVAISYDEMVLASSDEAGTVILWKRSNE